MSSDSKPDLALTLVSHASVVIRTPDGGIWTDPWLHSRAFNDSWSLLGDVAYSESMLDDVRWIWLSHEHPDHFNIPTLRGLPEEFKSRVTVLFQANNSDKMKQACHKLGFPNFRTLPHRAVTNLAGNTDVYCYQVGQMDSVLWVRNGDSTVLDVNDAEMAAQDCRMVIEDVEKVDVVLNQFSVAGYNGMPNPEEKIPAMADQILTNMVDNHRDLGASVTVPIASFVYFGAPDNWYVNQFANTPADVAERFSSEGLGLKVVRPGETYAVGDQVDNIDALAYWGDVYTALDDLPRLDPPVVEIDAIELAFRRRAALMADRFPRPLLGQVSPLVITVPDLNETIRFSFATGEFSKGVSDAEPDAEVNSQPLHFMLSNPFGLQTLGVSARYKLINPSRRWKLLRVLMSLENAEIYLRPKHLANPRLLRHLAQRSKGSVGQLAYQVRRM